MEHEAFKSTATIYKPGGGSPFPPGSSVPLQPDHAAAFRAAGLEAKSAPAPKADKPAPGAEASKASGQKS